MYGRFAWGLPGFVRSTISLDEARSLVQRRLEERDRRFIVMLERGVLRAPRSPYPKLMALAGCEIGDIKAVVRSRGLQAALRALRAAGVYVTFEEFKGRTPIVRGGRVIEVTPQNFDNPFLSKCFEAESGGSTGVATRVTLDLDHYVAQAPLLLLTYHAHGIVEAPRAMWFGRLPDSTGLGTILVTMPFRNIPRRWFVPAPPGRSPGSIKGRLATAAVYATGRLSGLRVPWPENLPLEQAGVIARWVASTLRKHGQCVVGSHLSKAMRVCLAASEEGLDIRGAVFTVGGEPPTKAKTEVFRRVGARHVPSYWFREAGCIGQACAQPDGHNDIHLFSDAHALIQAPRPVPGVQGVNVDAFLFTSLLPTAPKLLLNVESDDYGIVEKRRCGCFLGECGLTTHVREIRSYRKLTGEGVTLVGSDVLTIIEDLLPERFGGSPLDYQLHEEEDEHGFTRLTLVVSPRLEIPDEDQLITTVLEAISTAGDGGALAREVLDDASTLQVRREEPTMTAAGKLMPLHLRRRTTSGLNR